MTTSWVVLLKRYNIHESLNRCTVVFISLSSIYLWSGYYVTVEQCIEYTLGPVMTPNTYLDWIPVTSLPVSLQSQHSRSTKKFCMIRNDKNPTQKTLSRHFGQQNETRQHEQRSTINLGQAVCQFMVKPNSFGPHHIHQFDVNLMFI